MGMFSNLNKRRTIKDGIETEKMDFRKLSDFCGNEFIVNGFFFTQGKYGKQVVVVASNGYLINMPARAVEQFEQINGNDVMLDAMLAGKLAIGNIKDINTKNGKTTAYDFIDK